VSLESRVVKALAREMTPQVVVRLVLRVTDMVACL
jgi:hypothetical protein